MTVLAAGGTQAAAIKEGKLFAWGANSHGCLGLRDVDRTSVPTEVAGVTQASAVVFGWSHSALVADGRLYTSGKAAHGQLGY